jgi:hypothetical protein
VQGTALVAECMSHGFVEDQIRFAMRRLARKRLTETPYGHYREIDVPDSEPSEQFHYRATSIGIYHLQFWSGSFAFIDATSTDTPIFENDLREQITKLAPSFEIRDRYKRADAFRTYLQRQWQLANINVPYFDLVSIIQSQNASFKSVKDFIDRGSQQTSGKRWGWRPKA